MPAGIPMAMDPGRLRAMQLAAAQGDPQAQQALQQMQGGGGMSPPGMPQGGGPGGGMGPAGPMPPAGGAPPMQGMTQSQFGNGSGAPPADVQARRAQMLIQMLRARGDK